MNHEPHTWARLYIMAPLKEGVYVELDAKQSHYLIQVMRYREGEPVRLFNGKDGEWRATLAQKPKGKKDATTLFVENLLRPQTPEPDLWLCAAPIKRHYFDFIIMKATELGVSVIQPVLTKRTQVRDLHPERSLSIAIEAAEQSERLSLPIIEAPRTLESLIKTWPTNRSVILCAEHGEAKPIAQALNNTAEKQIAAAIFTGPEGGYTTEELEQIQTLPDVLPVRLGPRILRADTAGLAALSIWQALKGDWQERDVSDRKQ